jgi:hypothetical protein
MRFKGFKTGSFISVGNRGLNPTISLARTRRVDNPVWNFTLPHTFQGTVAGYATRSAVINKFPFAADANATDVGDLSVSRSLVSGQSSEVNGYTSGGFGPTFSNVIDKFPFASNGNATDVGDLTAGRYGPVGQSSPTNGYVSGGKADSLSPPALNFVKRIDKFPFATDANATNIGNIGGYSITGRFSGAGQSSTESGYTSGGVSFGPIAWNVIDKFPFATDASATNVGTLSVNRTSSSGQSSDVSGYTSGGLTPTGSYATPGNASNVIDKFPFATNASATDVGDLTVARSSVSGQSSTVSGYMSGGSTTNIIDKFPFASNANATDVGDLVSATDSLAGQQD